MSRRRLTSIVLAVVALGVIAAPPATAAVMAPSTSTTLILTNDTPTSTTIGGSPDSPVGTESFHEAIVRNAKGQAVGTFHASVLTVDVSPGDVTETRLRTVVFDLKGGQIVATGVAVYPASEKYLAVQASSRIAIVGGTGSYLGALGQMVTTKKDDGTYRQVLTLLQR